MTPLDGTIVRCDNRAAAPHRIHGRWGALVFVLAAQLTAGQAALADAPLSPNQAVSLDDEPVVPPPGTDPPPATATVTPPEQTAAAPASRELRRPARPGNEGGPVSSFSRSWNPLSLWPLGVVLGLIALAAWFVRRWVPGAAAGGSSALRVLARVGVTPRQHAVLVQCGRRLLLVGASPDRMELLCEITDALECAELASRVGAAGVSPEFSDALVREARAYVDEEPAARSRPEVGRRGTAVTPSGAAELIQRLRTLKAGQQEA